MRGNDIEAVRQLEGADGGIEREIMAQSVLGFEADFIAVAAPDGDFVPGVYEIMPMIKRSPADGDTSYESAHFHRPRHHRSVPDRLIAGMNTHPPLSLEQLDVS
jgi:hypothetical protein